MTRDEFVKRWRYHLTGLAVYGTLRERTEGPLAKAASIWEVPAEVEKLLAQMYADLCPVPAGNGKPLTTARKP